MRPHKAPSQGIGRELGTHERSCPDLKHQTTGCNVRPGPERSEGPASGVLPLCTARTRSAVRVPCPDLKHQTTGCNVRPGPERSEGPPNGIVFVFTFHYSPLHCFPLLAPPIHPLTYSPTHPLLSTGSRPLRFQGVRGLFLCLFRSKDATIRRYKRAARD